MTNMNTAQKTEQAQLVVLSKLSSVGAPLNMLEIGFTATPAVIRNMAARGLIRVTVEMTPRGVDQLASIKAKRLRIATNKAKEISLAERRMA